jgi:hypothetical protein
MPSRLAPRVMSEETFRGLLAYPSLNVSQFAREPVPGLVGTQLLRTT